MNYPRPPNPIRPLVVCAKNLLPLFDHVRVLCASQIESALVSLEQHLPTLFNIFDILKLAALYRAPIMIGLTAVLHMYTQIVARYITRSAVFIPGVVPFVCDRIDALYLLNTLNGITRQLEVSLMINEVHVHEAWHLAALG